MLEAVDWAPTSFGSPCCPLLLWARALTPSLSGNPSGISPEGWLRGCTACPGSAERLVFHLALFAALDSFDWLMASAELLWRSIGWSEVEGLRRSRLDPCTEVEAVGDESWVPIDDLAWRAESRHCSAAPVRSCFRSTCHFSGAPLLTSSRDRQPRHIKLL